MSWDPIGHVSPLPRIAINDPRPASPNVDMPTVSIAEMMEHERIIKLLRKTAEATNISGEIAE